MEILSTGEKIKRARIYKGITLKELCGDKISISKMSCIENEKIKAEIEILEYVSSKLLIDVDYLLKDVKEQLISNLELLKDGLFSDKDIESKIKYNLDFAQAYKYYDLAFDLMHLLFNYYLEEGKYENIQIIVSQYYFLHQNNKNSEKVIEYFYDMAKYFFNNKEYMEALSYYSRLKEILKENGLNDKGEYAYALYSEGLCYYKLKDNNQAFENMKEVVQYIDYVEDNISKGKIYNLLATLCIKLRKSEAGEFIEKAYEYQKDNPVYLALSKGNYGECYFEIGEKEKAKAEFNEGLNIFPKFNKVRYVEFMNNFIKLFIENGEYDEAYKVSDESLNLAIDCNNIRLIEQSYYLKGSILQKQGKYKEAEMYMNLSLDSLFKFGSKEERYNRYIDMANMYYHLGDIRDALKYFSLAFALEKNL